MVQTTEGEGTAEVTLVLGPGTPLAEVLLLHPRFLSWA